MTASTRSKKQITLYSEKFLLRLLDQQLFCFGKDIKSPLGNRLLEEGFKRTPPLSGVGTPAYELFFGESYLCLWGQGIFYGEKNLGGVYISRQKLPPLFSVHWTQPYPFWAPEHESEMYPPQTVMEVNRAYSLMGSCFGWLSKFEKRILRDRGEEYRWEILVERKLRCIPPKLVPSLLEEFNVACNAESIYDSLRVMAKKYKTEIVEPSRLRCVESE